MRLAPHSLSVIRNMPKDKSDLEKAAGKLISAIQKEWGNELGESSAEISELVMNKGHDLLAGAKDGTLLKVLNGVSVTEFLGETWVRRHPSVKESIKSLEVAIASNGENV